MTSLQSAFSRLALLTLMVCMFPASALLAQQPPFVVMTNGNTVQVERILARPNGDLVVTRNGQPIELKWDQVARAVGVRPPELNEALRLLQQGKTGDAKPLLQQVIRESAFKSWDVMAGVRLANISLEEGSGSTAQQILSGLEKRYGDRAETFFPEIEFVEWKTRVVTNQFSGLERELTEVIQEGENRTRRGMALLVRGDLKRKQTDNKAAVLDYLRTSYFYPENQDLQAEALYKTADTFSEIGDSARARKYATQLKEQYPDSEFASKKVGQ